jgi:hypothetical protein
LDLICPQRQGNFTVLEASEDIKIQIQCSFVPGDYNSGILEHFDDKKPQDLSELVLVTSRMKMKESIEI